MNTFIRIEFQAAVTGLWLLDNKVNSKKEAADLLSARRKDYHDLKWRAVKITEEVLDL